MRRWIIGGWSNGWKDGKWGKNYTFCKNLPVSVAFIGLNVMTEVKPNRSFECCDCVTFNLVDWSASMWKPFNLHLNKGCVPWPTSRALQLADTVRPSVISLGFLCATSSARITTYLSKHKTNLTFTLTVNRDIYF